MQHQPCLSEGEILLESGEDRVRGRQRALDVGQSLSQLLLVIEAQPDEALVCLRTRAHRLNNRGVRPATGTRVTCFRLLVNDSSTAWKYWRWKSSLDVKTSAYTFGSWVGQLKTRIASLSCQDLP